MRDPKALGENIRRLRRERGLTQAALAQRLYVSAQNVSKWENGLSAPDVGNLCLLSEVLGVSIDRLFGGRPHPAGRVMIGIDGGGTKTEFCLFTEGGHILARERLAGTNPNVYGIEGAQATLKKGIDALLEREESVCAIYAGIAGCGAEQNQRAVCSFLKKQYPGVQIEVGNDAYSVIYSTPYFEQCIMAIMGTGSVVFVKKDKQLIRVGGWGYLLDDSFSGYAIGRSALMAALAAEDGIGQPTVLLEALQRALGGGVFESNPKIYRMPKEEIAAFAKFVFEAYAVGDAVAMEILQGHAARLREQLDFAARQHGGGTRVILAGGLTRDREILLSLLDREVFTYVFPTLPPIYGACHYCARMLGEPPEDFAERFEKDYLESIKEA